MKLFLCSDTISSNIKPDFEKLLGKEMKSSAVSFITTAANPEVDKSWMQKDIDLVNDMFQDVKLFDIENMTLEQMSKEFLSRDILWMNGGKVAYLMLKIRDSGLEKELSKILEKTIYVGSSAGSMIWSKSLEIAEWYPDDLEPGASKIEGIGLLDFQIYPHYEETVLDIIKKNKRKEEEYWLLKNNQAISYNNGSINTYGGKIKVLPREF